MSDRISPVARLALVASLGAVAAALIFLALSAATHRIGLPLDDAWIHQTYARNLAANGEWAFVPGEASGGSTSPAWTLLLAIGHAAGIGPLAWVFALGTAALAGAGVLSGVWLRKDARLSSSWAILGALLVVLEWHLVWSAVSGMESIAFATLVVAVMLLSAGPSIPAVAVGVLIGLGVWVRPDAVTLLAIPVIALVGARERTSRQRLTSLAGLGLGFAVPFAAYLLFNLSTAGTAWPSTFYSKQAEYGALRSTPFFERILRLGREPLIGVGVLLLPAAVVMIVEAVRRREWPRLAPAVWAVAYLVLYAARLPVTYQHGRYQVPIVPVVLLLGWQGIGVLRRSATGRRSRLLTTAWAAAVFAVGIGFIGLGGRAYAGDVAIIETEMVEAARWIESNTEPEALIAAHDIGALGYFGGREVLDLAGLTDPEAIPIVRDEAALAEWMSRAGADYLMTFPEWYPRMTACAELVHNTGAAFSPAAGGENMAVYRWPVVRPEGCMLYSP